MVIMASEMHMPPPPFVYPSELPTYIDSYIGTTQRGRGGLDIGDNLLLQSKGGDMCVYRVDG